MPIETKEFDKLSPNGLVVLQSLSQATDFSRPMDNCVP